MRKTTTKLYLDSAEIELTMESDRKNKITYFLWINNKATSDHVGVTLDGAELEEVRQMLNRARP